MATTTSAPAGQGHTDTGAAGTGEQNAGAAGAGDGKGAAAGAAANAEPGKAGTDAGAGAAAAGAGTGAGADGKGGKADDGTGAAATGAPEKYALTLPEKSTLDDGDLKVIEQIARENNWTNDEAQAALERHNVTLIEQSERFAAETKADPTYGGENLATTQARAKALLDRVRPASTPAGKALRALLDKSGYGNHIQVVSLLADLGKMMEEDSPAHGGDGGGAKTIEDKLYNGQ